MVVVVAGVVVALVVALPLQKWTKWDTSFTWDMPPKMKFLRTLLNTYSNGQFSSQYPHCPRICLPLESVLVEHQFLLSGSVAVVHVL